MAAPVLGMLKCSMSRPHPAAMLASIAVALRRPLLDIVDRDSTCPMSQDHSTPQSCEPRHPQVGSKAVDGIVRGTRSHRLLADGIQDDADYILRNGHILDRLEAYNGRFDHHHLEPLTRIVGETAYRMGGMDTACPE